MGPGYTFEYLAKLLFVRWKFIAGCVGAGIMIAALVFLTSKPVYKSTATLVAGVRAPETIGPQSVEDQLSADYLLTQEDILKSDRVAEQVVRDTRIAEMPGAAERFGWSPKRGALTDHIAKQLGYGLVVESSATNSRVLEISYLSGDPVFSARMANAFAKAFISVNVQLQSDPARRNIESYTRQLKMLSKEMSTLQAELAAKERERSIVASKGEEDPDSSRLIALSTNLASAQAAAAQAGSAAGGGALPDALSSPVVQNLQTQIAQQEAQLRQLGTVLGPNHPDYRQVVAQIAALRSELGAQQALVRRAASVRAAQATQAKNRLSGDLAAQRGQVIENRAAQNEVAVMQQNLSNLRASYDQISQRRAQLQVLDNTAQTNISQLSTAVPNPRSVGLKKTMALIVGTLAGLATGLVLALIHELADRRIRVSDQLESWLGIPDLGGIRSNDDQRLAMVRRISGFLPKSMALLPAPGDT